MRVTLKSSEIGDVYKLAASLRENDARELVGMGGDPLKIIRANYRHGILRTSYFVDGEIAAMTGLCGGALADEGLPYLFTTAAVEKVPISFLKEARAMVRRMLILRKTLTGYVAADYEGAMRLLTALGFDLGEREIWKTGVAFRKFTRNR